jgi:glycosyltransferase involved in cell wall biosynthesis
MLFPPGDGAGLAGCLETAASSPEVFRALGRNARRLYERELTGDANYRQLMNIYVGALPAPLAREVSS